MDIHLDNSKIRSPIEFSADPPAQRFDPLRAQPSPLQEIDENGDMIFRFQLDLSETNESMTLAAFYREHIHDLLKIVRFYANGKPVIFDSFAFHHKPQEQIAILLQQENQQPK